MNEPMANAETSRQSPEDKPAGLVTHLLAEDHRRLEGLLESALASGGSVEGEQYDRFRAGLLRHIGIEEKILLPEAQRLRGGEPLLISAKLRLDHGAIVALLMPTPTPGVIAALRSILNAHNVLEEGQDGLYVTCDRLVSGQSDQLMIKLCAASEPSVLPHSDTPAVRSAVRRALERAGHEVLLPLLPT